MEFRSTVLIIKGHGVSGVKGVGEVTVNTLCKIYNDGDY